MISLHWNGLVQPYAFRRAVADEIRKGNVVGARQAVRRLMGRTRVDTRKALELVRSVEA